MAELINWANQIQAWKERTVLAETDLAWRDALDALLLEFQAPGEKPAPGDQNPGSRTQH